MLFTEWETRRVSDGVCAGGRQGGCGALGCDVQKWEGTQVESLLRTSQGLLQHSHSLCFLSPRCVVCVYMIVCFCMYVSICSKIHVNVQHKCRHHSSRLCVSDDCACMRVSSSLSA